MTENSQEPIKRRYKFWQPLWLAFYSKDFYRDVYQHWRGSVFIYLFILSAICSLSIIYRSPATLTHILKNILTNLEHLPIYCMYGLVLIGAFLLGIIEALVYATLAKIFIKCALNYTALIRLAIVAITPKFILSAVLPLLSLTFTYQWILYFALGMGYLVFAIEANRSNKPTDVT